MSWFRKSETGLDRIAQQTVGMLGDARHSFDLASTAVLSGADPATIGQDIAATDARINETELQIRSELVVHVAVRGNADIGAVLGYMLLIKKVERIGDQAKNIFDLASEGVSLAGAEDLDEFLARRDEISRLYVAAAELLTVEDEERARALLARTSVINDECAVLIADLMRSERPGSWAVPRAMLYRYWKRIVANLAGITTAAIEPFQTMDYLEHGAVDIDD
ncbi:MAG: PhoU domain-containing protein [Acidimicrobiales bacterium]